MPRFASLLTCFGLALVVTSHVARADNWERFRGPNGTGISNDKNILTEFSATTGVLWKAPSGEGNASPIVWGNRLFLHTTSIDGKQRSLICLDTADGKEVWKKTIKAIKPNQIVRKDSSYASSTPTTDGQMVYVSFWDGKDVILAAYSFKNGDGVWMKNLGEFVSQHGPGASPILYQDKLIFANDQDSHYNVTSKNPDEKRPVANASQLLALNKKTGQTVWEMPREAHRACYSAPFVLTQPGKTPELIITSTTAITSYDPDSGKANWSWKWSFPGMALRTIASTTYIDGLLLSSSGDGSGDRHMAAVAMNGFGKDARPDQIWQNNKDFPYVTCMLTRGQHVYFVNDSGLAGCYHAKTGKKVWFERIPDARFYASPVMIDGKIYAASEQGKVYVIAAEPTGYQLLATNQLGERIRATPAVADGRLYIRGQYNLFCIGK